MNEVCQSCSIGKLMGQDSGGHCPFLEEELAAGSTIFERGEAAIFSWFLRSGTAVLFHESGSIEVVRGPSDRLGPVLIRGGRRTARAIAISDVFVCRGANAVLTQQGEWP